MRSTKRVILANGSRLLREMLQLAIEKADDLEVVQQVRDQEKLPAAIERFEPQWVIVSPPCSEQAERRIAAWLADYPSVGFVFLSPDRNHITMKWTAAYEQEYADLSLIDFLQILETDRQCA